MTLQQPSVIANPDANSLLILIRCLFFSPQRHKEHKVAHPLPINNQQSTTNNQQSTINNQQRLPECNLDYLSSFLTHSQITAKPRQDQTHSRSPTPKNVKRGTKPDKFTEYRQAKFINL